MKKLKIAFLWHQHQPFYKMENEFILPWVLLHGTKDYYDIPEVLYEFPNIKQTFNFAPSLNLQIADYISCKTKDRVQRLTEKSPETLSNDEKREIISLFFHANFENMISPYPRYLELFNLSRDVEYAVNHFSEQDWMDLQVWYNLVWFGFYSKQLSIPKRLFLKGKDFSQIEKQSLQQVQNEILKKINYQYRKLKELGQIELSCSPMFHPILPLIIDSAAALESRPDNQLPDPLFNFPDDARLQIKQGMDYFEKTFGEKPQGMWPSEGSVSDATLNMLAEAGIKWVATDEQVLFDSLAGISHKSTDKFFPRLFKGKNGNISILFRDHYLSDRIGFVYSNWNEHDAALDFVNHLRSIRNEIINNHGEQALDYACVSVILDGENCWEYYKDNGIPFLRQLFSEFNNYDELTTVTCQEAVSNQNSAFLPELTHIAAGSWINANFDIWIGHNDDIKAWNMLSKARHTLESFKNTDIAKYNSALECLLIAEGSDWFWWYGPEHITKNKPDFDKLFRHYIRHAYETMGVEVPADVFIPIEKQTITSEIKVPAVKIESLFNQNFAELLIQSGSIKLFAAMSAMHKIGEILDSLNYGNDDNYLYLRLKYLRNISGDFEIKLYFEEFHHEIFITHDNFRTDISSSGIMRYDDGSLIILPLELFGKSENIQLRIETRFNNSYLKYPQSGGYELKRVL